MVQVFIGAALLAVVIVMSILLICGLPLGEFSMGGRFGKVWPPKIRLIGVTQLLTQVFALYIILAGGTIVPYFVNLTVTRVICYVFAVFFFGNTFTNIISPSKKEKYVMTPMSLAAAVCFLITAIIM
ncbi:MAG: hypothetical protein J6T15_06605 [Bacilli bacterium]|nr:hypothetical protein [Bacilli bacterium]